MMNSGFSDRVVGADATIIRRCLHAVIQSSSGIVIRQHHRLTFNRGSPEWNQQTAHIADQPFCSRRFGTAQRAWIYYSGLLVPTCTCTVIRHGCLSIDSTCRTAYELLSRAHVTNSTDSRSPRFVVEKPTILGRVAFTAGHVSA